MPRPRKPAFPFRCFNSSPEVIRLVVLMYVRFAGEALPAFSWVWLTAALGLGADSALIQLTMNWAQKAVTPTRATIIYASEPVWGGVVGRLAGDRLPSLALLGVVFIVAGVIVSELKPRRSRGGQPQNIQCGTM